MSFKGGYLIINLEGGGKAYEKGIYDAIEGNYDKMIVLSGITINGSTYPDIAVNLDRTGTDYFAYVYGRKITISDNDTITLSQYDEDMAHVYLDAPSAALNPSQQSYNVPGINAALNYAHIQRKTLILRAVSFNTEGGKDAGNVEIKPEQRNYAPMTTSYNGETTFALYYLSIADGDAVSCHSLSYTVTNT